MSHTGEQIIYILARFSTTAIDGIYNFSIKSKAKASITVSTGSKETIWGSLSGWDLSNY